ncbi:antibiotic biosynthesis monooxygenase [Novosphingobium sp. TH158]|uniref:antibiotic biosynthesis monooxygenase family protein n=1 Tax=Novosphingobium sp. TH158 TaxID=2067455 RepID=UPI000C7A12FD|nr:antibiotic biosynthesis monooxygenase [Novosphingobium sp. TH158]PLK24439.1 polysaccharide biosynthesis protein [Novosphingobium sp. TH158]
MYLTVFRNRKRPGMDAAAYAADAQRMVELASQEPGFRSVKTFHADDGEVVTISEWESEAAAKAWGRHPEHAAVQARGRGQYYAWYESISLNDPQIRTFERHD